MVHVLHNVQQQYIASTDCRGVVIEVEGQGLLRLALSSSPKKIPDIATSQHENLQSCGRSKHNFTGIQHIRKPAMTVGMLL
jgi:hypothetical protein